MYGAHCADAIDRCIQSRRILITGGAGFIGSHLADALIARGDRVIVLDDLSTGRRDNIEHLLEHRRTSSSSRARRSTRELVDELVARRPTSCFHLASAVGVQLIVVEPARVAAQATSAAPTTCSSAAARHGRRLLFTSTSEVYGKNSTGALTRTPTASSARRSSRAGPTRSPRASASRWPTATTATRGRRSIVVRLFNTRRPAADAACTAWSLPRFVRQALAGEDLTVYGNGTQTRCFAHVARHGAGAPAAARQRRRGRAACSTSAPQTEIADHRARAARDRADRLGLEDPARALRRGLRRGLRGARPAQAGHHARSAS